MNIVIHALPLLDASHERALYRKVGLLLRYRLLVVGHRNAAGRRGFYHSFCLN